LTGDDGGSAGHDSNSEDDQGVNCMGMAVVIAVQSTNEIRAVSRLLESSSRVPSRWSPRLSAPAKLRRRTRARLCVQAPAQTRLDR